MAGTNSNYEINSPWPSFRGNKNGQSNFNGPRTNNTLWKYNIGASIDSSPAIGSDGTVYIGSKDSNLYAFNVNGSFKWKYQTGGTIFTTSPTLGADCNIYIGSQDQFLYVISPTGSLVWRYYTAGTLLFSSPAIHQHTVYIASQLTLYAISSYSDSFKLKWTFRTTNTFQSSPIVLDDGTIFIGNNDNHFYSLSSQGSLNWKYDIGSYIISTPAIASLSSSSSSSSTTMVVYFGAADSNVYALNQQGTLLWKYLTGDVIMSSPAISSTDNVLYIGSTDYYLYALYTEDIDNTTTTAVTTSIIGSLKWKFFVDRDIYFSSPLIDSSRSSSSRSSSSSSYMIYIGSQSFGVYAISSYGTLIWKYMTLSFVTSSPALGADGTLYIGSSDGYLYAFNSNIGSSTSSGSNTIYLPSDVVCTTAPTLIPTYSPTISKSPLSSSSSLSGGALAAAIVFPLLAIFYICFYCYYRYKNAYKTMNKHNNSSELMRRYHDDSLNGNNNNDNNNTRFGFVYDKGRNKNNGYEGDGDVQYSDNLMLRSNDVIALSSSSSSHYSNNRNRDASVYTNNDNVNDTINKNEVNDDDDSHAVSIEGHYNNIRDSIDSVTTSSIRNIPVIKNKEESINIFNHEEFRGKISKAFKPSSNIS